MFEPDFARFSPTAEPQEHSAFVGRWHKVARETGSQDLAKLVVKEGLKLGQLNAVTEMIGIFKPDPYGTTSVPNEVLCYVKEAADGYAFAELSPMYV